MEIVLIKRKGFLPGFSLLEYRRIIRMVLAFFYRPVYNSERVQ